MFVEFTDHWFPSRLVCVQQIPQISDQILLPFLCDTNPPLLSSPFGAWTPNISQSIQWESMWWQHWEILKRVVIYSFRSWVLVQISFLQKRERLIYGELHPSDFINNALISHHTELKQGKAVIRHTQALIQSSYTIHSLNENVAFFFLVYIWRSGKWVGVSFKIWPEDLRG